MNFAAQRINQDARIFVCVDTGETSDVDVDRLIETPNDVHAGEIETSTSLAIRPRLVRMDRLQMEVPEFTSRYLDFTSTRGRCLVCPHPQDIGQRRHGRPHQGDD